MKKIIKNINIDQVIKIVYLCIVLISISGIIHAQPSDPGSDPDNAPIDGGLSLLIAGGVGYGVKKIREKRKSQETRAKNQEEQENK